MYFRLSLKSGYSIGFDVSVPELKDADSKDLTTSRPQPQDIGWPSKATIIAEEAQQVDKPVASKELRTQMDNFPIRLEL
jgi:hypothetical protein